MTRKSRLITAGIAILALGAVGLVYAAWTTNGSGSGYAKAGSSQALTTIDVSASTTADLYPGTDGDVVLEVSNPNPYPVRVTDEHGLTIDIPASGSTQATLANAAHMSNASQTGCQGATFTIPVSLTGASNAS
jgi:hypothetical protein